MADKRVTELALIDTVSGSDLLMVVDDPAGAPVNKKATQDQLLAPAAKLAVANTFLDTQTVNGDLIVTGEINPARWVHQKPKVAAFFGGRADGVRTLLSNDLAQGMSLQFDENIMRGRIGVGNVDTQVYQGLQLEAEELHVLTGVSPVLMEHVRIHRSGGVSVGGSTDHASDPGLGTVRAMGFVAMQDVTVVGNLGIGGSASVNGSLMVTGGLASTPLNASQLLSGTVPTAALPSYYDYSEVTPPNPAANTMRVYGVDFNGFSFLEQRDSNGLTLRLGRDAIAIAKVAEPGGITKGQAVYIFGASGSTRLIKLALADSRDTTPAIGVAMETGANNAFIRVINLGVLTGLDTSAYPEGDRVFLSATVPGGLTPTFPVAPHLVQRVGFCLRQHATQGELGIYPATAVSESAWLGVHAAMHQPGGRDPLPNVPWTNTANTFTQKQTMSGDLDVAGSISSTGPWGFYGAQMYLTRSAPVIGFTESDQPANSKNWFLRVADQTLMLGMADDGWGEAPILTLARSGMTAQFVGNVTVGGIRHVVAATRPWLVLSDTSSAAGSRNFGLTSAGAALQLYSLSDAFGMQNLSIEVDRAGNVGMYKNLNVYGGTVAVGSTLLVASGLTVSGGGASITGNTVINNLTVNAGGIAVTGTGAISTASGNIQAAGNFHNSAGYVYPGQYGSGAYQGNWYLGSHGSYGLYANTGLYLESGLWATGIEARAHIRAAAGLYDYARGTPIGDWIDAYPPSFVDGAITGQSGSMGYSVIGHTTLIHLKVTGNIAGNPGGNYFFIYTPGGATNRYSYTAPMTVYCGGTWETGSIHGSAGLNYGLLYRAGIAAWPAGTVYVTGMWFVPIN